MVAFLEYPAMPSQQDSEKFEWGYLIRPDKSPSPQLEQLCLGIANLISELETSTPGEGLTPERLAAFYRTVGGNYDTLFLSTPNSSLSFIYQSLGCFHTLQPTSNAFEPPSIPSLLPHGFVRWQTIQLLLCPEEHAGFLKEAVKHFDVINPITGTVFPKDIPRDAFPAEPDAEMVQWHETVGKRLELEYEASRVRKASAPQDSRRPGHPSNPQPAHLSDKVHAEHDYFSQDHSYSSRAARPRTPLRTQPHEAYSPFTRPGGHGREQFDDPPELDADLNHGYRHVDLSEDSDTQFPHTYRSRSSSRQAHSRGRSRAPIRQRRPSQHKGSSNVVVDSSEPSASCTDDDREEESEPEQDPRHFRRTKERASRSTDGRRRRGLHSRLLSPDCRRHSHDSPLSQSQRSRSRNYSRSPYRRPHPPSHLHRTIQVEIHPSETELDTDADLDHRMPRHPPREHELDNDDEYDDDDGDGVNHYETDGMAEQYTPETKHARGYYYYAHATPSDMHHAPRSSRSGRKSRTSHDRDRGGHAEAEYIVLPSSSIGTGNPSSSSNTTSPSTAATATPPTPIRTAKTSSSKPIKYKEYILIEPDSPPPKPPPPTFTIPTYSSSHPRGPSSQSRHRYGGGGSATTHTPISVNAPPPPAMVGRRASHNPSRSGSSESNGGGTHHLRGTRYP
ncbi:hypothetical protein VTO42DRAFT_2010 [Malbranchea cinnamomea]